MTDPADPLASIERAAGSLIPELTRRLETHRLGELEVRHGPLRVRVRAAARAESGAGPDASSITASAQAAPDTGAERETTSASVPDVVPVASPAVGIFVYGEGLGPGMLVSAGDALGHVEMLGVRYEVRAPGAGRVSHLVTETGEAVEYGQLLMELDRDVDRDRDPAPARNAG